MEAKESSLLKRLREQKVETQKRGEDAEARKSEWIEEVERLMEKLHGWLRDAEQEELLKIDRTKVRCHEKLFGDYAIEGLVISTPDGRVITITPKARFVVGFNGRVDLESGPRKATLVKSQAHDWTFFSPDVPRELTDTGLLTKESFLEVVEDLIT